jgi:hypothetical protein
MTRAETESMNLQQRVDFWNTWNERLGIGGIIRRSEDTPQFERLKDVAIQTEQSTHFDIESAVKKTRPVYQDGHWIVEAQSRSSVAGFDGLRILPVACDGLLGQSVTIPRGNWLVRWRYRPWFHYPALAIASTGWFCVLIATAFYFLRRFKLARLGRLGISPKSGRSSHKQEPTASI